MTALRRAYVGATVALLGIAIGIGCGGSTTSDI